ncbi:MAG: CBS domain-containing protein, partial [Psychroflexus sp.]|nr:CBS domain-containing protein [Psychroflexus sp.]
VNEKAEEIKVKDCMSPNVILFRKGQSIIEVVETIMRYRISGGPVVDENEKLIGVISEGDCIKQISDSRYYNMPMELTLVENYMTKSTETISPDTNLFDVAQKFITSKHRRFPVVKDEKIIGIVSQKDVLRTALMLKGYSWKHKS